MVPKRRFGVTMRLIGWVKTESPVFYCTKLEAENLISWQLKKHVYSMMQKLLGRQSKERRFWLCVLEESEPVLQLNVKYKFRARSRLLSSLFILGAFKFRCKFFFVYSKSEILQRWLVQLDRLTREHCRKYNQSLSEPIYGNIGEIYSVWPETLPTS